MGRKSVASFNNISMRTNVSISYPQCLLTYICKYNYLFLFLLRYYCKHFSIFTSIISYCYSKMPLYCHCAQTYEKSRRLAFKCRTRHITIIIIIIINNIIIIMVITHCNFRCALSHSFVESIP